MNELRQRFGRPLRLGIIGGGPGVVDRPHASQGGARSTAGGACVAGVFSSDPARSRAAGVARGLRPRRAATATSREMLAKEKQRADGIDAVAIMTPNDTHYPYAAAALDAGLDVVVRQAGDARFRARRATSSRARATARAACSRSRTATPPTR